MNKYIVITLLVFCGLIAAVIGSVSFASPSIPCPAYAAPYCPNGKLISAGSDARGCGLGSTCCGDKTCRGQETAVNCPADCAPVASGVVKACPQYAPPSCPLGKLIGAGLDNNGCPQAASCCGDNRCEKNENTSNCPTDCNGITATTTPPVVKPTKKPDKYPCPMHAPPYCPNGQIVPGDIDKNGCRLAPTCCKGSNCVVKDIPSQPSLPDQAKPSNIQCREYSPPYCPNGRTVSAGNDKYGCTLGATCCGNKQCEGREDKNSCPSDCFATTAQDKQPFTIKESTAVKILGLFNTKMTVINTVDSQTGSIVSTKKPWWNFLAW